MRIRTASIVGLLLAAGTLNSHAQVFWNTPSAPDESPSFLGIYMQDLTADSAKDLGLKREQGVVCAEIIPDSPAEDAGLLPNDVVTRWDGARVRSSRHLKRLVGDTPVGRTVKVGIVRNREPAQIEATVGERDWGQMSLMSPPPQGRMPQGLNLPPWHPSVGGTSPFTELFGQDPPPRLGVALMVLSDQLGEFFGLGNNQGGVLVASVIEGTAAEAAGIRAGDIITAVQGEPVASPEEIQEAVRRADDTLDLTILRERKDMEIQANFAEHEAEEDEELIEEIAYPKGTM